MNTSHEQLLADNAYKLRQVTFISEAENYLHCLFHDPAYGNFPRDEKVLHSIMVKLDRNQKLNNLRPDQRALVLPKSKKTDSRKFDVSLLSQFLLYHVNLPKQVRDDIKGITKERNLVLHNPRITYDEFHIRWDSMETFLVRLGYDINIVKNLKSGSLNDLEHLQVSINKSKIEIQEFINQQNKDNIQQSKDNIQQNKDYIQQSKDNIQQSKDNIQQNKNNIQQNKNNIQQNKDNIQQNKNYKINMEEHVLPLLNKRLNVVEHIINDMILGQNEQGHILDETQVKTRRSNSKPYSLTWINIPTLCFIMFMIVPFCFGLYQMTKHVDMVKTDFVILQTLMPVLVITSLIYPLPIRENNAAGTASAIVSFLNAFDISDVIVYYKYIQHYGTAIEAWFFISVIISVILLVFPIDLYEEDEDDTDGRFLKSSFSLMFTDVSFCLLRGMVMLEEDSLLFCFTFSLKNAISACINICLIFKYIPSSEVQ